MYDALHHRGKRSNTDPCSDQYGVVCLKHATCGGTEWSRDINLRFNVRLPRVIYRLIAVRYHMSSLKLNLILMIKHRNGR